ncbi:hypothetical protein HRbin35_00390 [bacterium HR35]|nr:hypothetical protein HRbin35_00390 [bacterium HR35]
MDKAWSVLKKYFLFILILFILKTIFQIPTVNKEMKKIWEKEIKVYFKSRSVK